MTTASPDPQAIHRMAQAAREASRCLATTASEQRSGVLLRLAEELGLRTPEILAANAADVSAAAGLIDPSATERLKLDAAKLDAMATALKN